jgi:hypothetical protein
MKDARPALRYAKAILNLAKETKAETEVNADMQLIASTISENDDLSVMLSNPLSLIERVILFMLAGGIIFTDSWIRIVGVAIITAIVLFNMRYHSNKLATSND